MFYQRHTPPAGPSQGNWSARARAAGYTLLELVAVMTLLVVLAAMTFPLTRTLLADSRLTAGGDQMRARLADARALALEQGRPFRVAVVFGTGKFQVGPDDDATCWNTVSEDPLEDGEILRGTLPKDVVFCHSEDDLIGKGTKGPEGSGGWETAAVYLPDGSAREDADIYFGKMGQRPLRIQLRGLTGTVHVTDPNRPGGPRP